MSELRRPPLKAHVIGALLGVAVVQQGPAEARTDLAAPSMAAAPTPTPPVAAAVVSPMLPAERAAIEQQARLALAEGERQLEGRDFERALRAFTAAHTLVPGPQPLERVAAAALGAGLREEALLLYSRVAREAPPGPLQSAAAARCAELQSSESTPSADTLVRSYIERGKEAFRSGSFERAVAAYGVAHALQGLPRLLFNIAQAERRQGHPQVALAFYLRFLESSPPPGLQRETEGYVRELREVLARESLGAPRRAPRPRWRVAVGASAVGVGLGLAAFGVAGLMVDGRCVMPGTTGLCSGEFDEGGSRFALITSSRGAGAGLLTVGILSTAAGVVLLALPGERRSPQRLLASGSGPMPAGGSP